MGPLRRSPSWRSCCLRPPPAGTLRPTGRRPRPRRPPAASPTAPATPSHDSPPPPLTAPPTSRPLPTTTTTRPPATTTTLRQVIRPLPHDHHQHDAGPPPPARSPLRPPDLETGTTTSGGTTISVTVGPTRPGPGTSRVSQSPWPPHHWGVRGGGDSTMGDGDGWSPCAGQEPSCPHPGRPLPLPVSHSRLHAYAAPGPRLRDPGRSPPSCVVHAGRDLLPDIPLPHPARSRAAVNSPAAVTSAGVVRRGVPFWRRWCSAAVAALSCWPPLAPNAVGHGGSRPGGDDRAGLRRPRRPRRRPRPEPPSTPPTRGRHQPLDHGGPAPHGGGVTVVNEGSASVNTGGNTVIGPPSATVNNGPATAVGNASTCGSGPDRPQRRRAPPRRRGPSGDQVGDASRTSTRRATGPRTAPGRLRRRGRPRSPAGTPRARDGPS